MELVSVCWINSPAQTFLENVAPAACTFELPLMIELWTEKNCWTYYLLKIALSIHCVECSNTGISFRKQPGVCHCLTLYFRCFFCPSLLFSGRLTRLFLSALMRSFIHICFVMERWVSSHLTSTLMQSLFVYSSISLSLSSLLSLDLFSVPALFSPRLHAPSISHDLLTAGRITARSSAGGGIRWPLTSRSCQTWCPPAALWRANQTSSPSCAWPCHTWSLLEEAPAAAPAPMEQINLPFSQTRSDMDCIDYRNVFIPCCT